MSFFSDFFGGETATVSTSTIAALRTEIETNADYEEESDTAKAKAFISAARKLIMRLPAESRQGTTAVRHELGVLKEMQAEARTWLAAQGGGNSASGRGGVIHPDFSGGW